MKTGIKCTHTFLLIVVENRKRKRENMQTTGREDWPGIPPIVSFFLFLFSFFFLLLLCFFKGFCMCLFFFHLDVYEIEKVVGRHTSPHSACNMRICIMCFSFSIWNGKKQNGGSQSEKEELPFLLLCTNMDIVTVLWLGTLCGRLSARRSVSPESSPEIQKRKSTKIKPTIFFFFGNKLSYGKSLSPPDHRKCYNQHKTGFFFSFFTRKPTRAACLLRLIDVFFSFIFFSKGEKSGNFLIVLKWQASSGGFSNLNLFIQFHFCLLVTCALKLLSLCALLTERCQTIKSLFQQIVREIRRRKKETRNNKTFVWCNYLFSTWLYNNRRNIHKLFVQIYIIYVVE